MTDMAPASGDNIAVAIMQEFARVTGLDPPEKHPRRYLWTDAFAVCNFLELWQRTRDPVYRDLATRLIDQVHDVLGKHRDDDPRSGWISGLDEEDGRLHPTIGGLRIGKPLNERTAGEKPDERLEWDRDGQYFHYLTKWMHALCQAGRLTGDPDYIRWAAELAGTVRSRFFTGQGSRTRIAWKMSIDLTHPLVSSMGLHDPIDGLVTFVEVTLGEKRTGRSVTGLQDAFPDLVALCRQNGWETDDPLGIGSLLFDGLRLAKLITGGGFDCRWLLEDVIRSARVSMEFYLRTAPFRAQAGYRLAFRELGLSTGLRGIGILSEDLDTNPEIFGRSVTLRQNTTALARYVPVAGDIERFWADTKNQDQDTWRDHREINMAMLATSLVPGVFLSV